MKKFGVIAITALAVLLTGCGTSQNFQSQTISENDVSAISIDATTNFSVSRVVVLANGVAEIMNALNAKSILVGRDISSTEKELKDIPIVTSGHQVMPEKIIELKPDLVIIDASTGPKAALDQIRTAGIKIVETPESWTLADIPTKVSAVASAIGAPQQGDLLNQAFAKELKTSTVATKPRIAFLYLRGTSSVYLIGGPGSGSDSLIQAIGATDVGANPRMNGATAQNPASASFGSRCRHVFAESGKPCRQSASGPLPHCR